MTNEQREAIEYIQKQIDYFKEQIKFIEAVDCDYYEEEYELYKNRIKQFSTVLSLIKEQQEEIEKKDKQIDLMAEFISKYHCFEVTVYDLDDECKHEHECKDCIKQYFAKLTKKGVEYENNNKERRTRN